MPAASEVASDLKDEAIPSHKGLTGNNLCLVDFASLGNCGIIPAIVNSNNGWERRGQLIANI